jgi:gluconate 2-dehydrogenase gamma chain
MIYSAYPARTIKMTNPDTQLSQEEIIERWNELLTPEVIAAENKFRQRRMLLKSIAVSAFIPVGLSLSACSEDKSPAKQATKKPGQPLAAWEKEPWATYDAVLSFILPSDAKSPGAREIHATRYLYFALHMPEVNKELFTFMKKSIHWLNASSKKRHKKPFREISHGEKESLLRAIEKTKSGDYWLGYVYRYLFEALLTDPVYGGNPNQIGWKWLEHQPGFPRPPRHKRYYKLK